MVQTPRTPFRLACHQAAAQATTLPPPPSRAPTMTLHRTDLLFAFALALVGGPMPHAVAGSLKWQSSNPDAPRPGPARPAGVPQHTEPDAPGDATRIDTPDPTGGTDPGIARSGDYLARMDTDGDGRVSLIEYQNWLSYAFDRMDANRDGVLTAEEQPGGRGGVLTLEAHRARVAETFRRQDANRDGSLDARELSAPPQAPGR